MKKLPTKTKTHRFFRQQALKKGSAIRRTESPSSFQQFPEA